MYCGLFLTREDEDVNVNIRDDFGLTPLFYTIGNGSQKAVPLFLARDNVEVNVRDNVAIRSLIAFSAIPEACC